MRSKIVAGNWKMNKTYGETKKFVDELKDAVKGLKLKNTRVIIAPPYTNLQKASKKTKNTRIEVAAQNMHQAENGAYTGEISAGMLRDFACKYVIIGHSERRGYFCETDEGVNFKVKSAFTNELLPIVCVGETLEENEGGQTGEVVKRQITAGLKNVREEQIEYLKIAYEPVWAIGTGETATPEQAQEMHAFIRARVAKKYSKQTAEECLILYGGSCNAGNAALLFSQPDVDGGLIGGASLKADDFAAIIRSA